MGVKHKSVSASIPCHSDSQKRLSGLKPSINIPGPQQHTSFFMSQCLQVSTFTGYYVQADMFYTSPLDSRHSHSCKVKKGHSFHQRAVKGCRKVGHSYPGWEKMLHGPFWGASPGFWRDLQLGGSHHFPPLTPSISTTQRVS